MRPCKQLRVYTFSPQLSHVFTAWLDNGSLNVQTNECTSE
jgi:hypothetical protein